LGIAGVSTLPEDKWFGGYIHSHVFYKRFLGTSSESLLAKLVRNISRHGFQFFTIFWEVSDLDVLEVPQQKKNTETVAKTLG